MVVSSGSYRGGRYLFALRLQWILPLVVLFSASLTRAEHDAVPGEYIIKFKNQSASAAYSHRQKLAVQEVRAMPLSGAELVRTTQGTKPNDAYLKQLLASGAVEYVEPNFLVSINRTANDPLNSELWGLHNTGQTGGTEDIDIDAPEAWDITTGSASVVVGIVDTGVNYLHPDLQGNMWVNPNEISGNGIDDDGNGVVDDIYGYNAVTQGGNPLDDHGHGSHTAGTIGARGNDARGVSGLNWNVKIMALKFLNASGSGTTADAISAIEYAVAMRHSGVNLRVLNNSWGGGGFSQALEDAIQAASDAGILFVAASGNSSEDNDASPTYPANYELPNIVSVAAVDYHGNLASFSNYGATTVDLAAPGVDILSTVLGDSYASYSGTSMATPHVTAVAALVAGAEGGISTTNLRARLLNTVQPISTLNGLMAKPGIVNARNALTNTTNPTPPAEPTVRYRKVATSFDHDSVLGNRVLQSDDGYATVDLGFEFPYYRTEFQRIAISANGRIVLLRDSESAPTTPDYSNRFLNGISPFHDDLFPAPAQLAGGLGGVWIKVDSSSAVVTWVVVNYGLRLATDANAVLTIQAKLFADGRIEFHYLDTLSGSATYDYGASATVGLIPPTGTPGERLVVLNNSSNEATVGNGRALKFLVGGKSVKDDFDGDGKSDMVTFSPVDGMWYVLVSKKQYAARYRKSYQLGLPGDLPKTGDFDGDQLADLAVWRPTDGTWYMRLSGTGRREITAVQWGLYGDTPLVDDFDGDGRTDLAVYRPANGGFYSLLSTSNFNRDLALSGSANGSILLQLGGLGHDPISGDFNGDGVSEFGVIWQLIRFWTVIKSDGQMLFSLPWGYPGDTPLACDWDNDGTADRVIVRANDQSKLDWYVATGSGSVFTAQFGVAHDTPSCDRDFDGDGEPDEAIFRASLGEWQVRYSSSSKLAKHKVGKAGIQAP